MVAEYLKTADAILRALTVTLDGVSFYMAHHKKAVPADLPGIGAVVLGRSHMYFREKKGGRWDLVDDVQTEHVGCEYGEYPKG